MQFYLSDKVKIKNGVFDKDSGEDYSGLEGRIYDIRYRTDDYPFKVEVYLNEEGNSFRNVNFKEDELELDE